MEADTLYIVYGLDQLPLKISGFEVPSYILSNQQRVFSVKGIQKIFQYDGKSDFWLANILNNMSIIPSVILDAYENPIIAKISSEDLSTIKMIDASVFIETCRIISETHHYAIKGDMGKIYRKAAALYKVIQNENIYDLINEASGYLFQKEHTKTLLSGYLEENLNDSVYAWTKTIPDNLYDPLLEIHELDWKNARENIQITAKIIHDIVFSRLPNEVLAELRLQRPKRSYTRKGKKPQDIEHQKLRNYTDGISSLLETSGKNLYMFLILLDRAFPVNVEYHAAFTLKETPINTKPPPSIFSLSLKKIP